MNANLSCSLPPLCANRIPVSSTVTPCICVKGSSHSRRSLLDQKDSILEAVRSTTLSAPGESLTKLIALHVHRSNGNLTDMCHVKFPSISPVIEVFHPGLSQCLTRIVWLRDSVRYTLLDNYESLTRRTPSEGTSRGYVCEESISKQRRLNGWSTDKPDSVPCWIVKDGSCVSNP